MSKTPRPGSRSTSGPNTSSEVGSIQCASSKSARTGASSASPSNSAINAAIVRSFCSAGAIFQVRGNAPRKRSTATKRAKARGPRRPAPNARSSPRACRASPSPGRRSQSRRIDPNDLAHVLRIEPRRQRGRAHEIGKHHRELATLGGVGDRRNRSGGGQGAAAGPASPATASAGACGALKTHLFSQGRRPSGRPELWRRCHSREIALRTVEDPGLAAKPRHPWSFPWTDPHPIMRLTDAVSRGFGKEPSVNLTHASPCRE